METTQILFKIKLTSVHIFLTSYLSGTGYEPAIHAIQLTKVSSFLMGHSRSRFLCFRLFNTVDSKQCSI